MRRQLSLIFSVLLAVSLWSSPLGAARDVANTLHNLSSSGPGTFKSLSIDQVCVFCHTPHNASPEAPLWNRQLSGQGYIEYGSSTLQANPGQPTGKSRLCLACHDGTVALGAFVNPPSGVANDVESTFLTGRANLGTDLTDDHPISFHYDASLQAADQELVSPATIDLPLEKGELQCTTCHDAHEKDIEPFLYKTTQDGTLCLTCHAKSGLTWSWDQSAHATSSATPSGGSSPWSERKPAWRGNTVAQNACFNCHTPHNAASPERLIKAQEEDTCALCHNGTVAAKNVDADFAKFYHHPIETTPNPDHDAVAVENPLTMRLHVECADCHNPHGAKDAPPMVSFNPGNPSSTDHTTPPNANARILGVSGIDLNGSVKPEIDYEYELCFKCHGVPARSACGSDRCSTAESFSMVRQDGVYNIREKVSSTSPGLISYHPIESNNPSNNTEVPSLKTAGTPMNKTTALIYCSDCHSGENSPATGGTGPAGPHGSNKEAMLAQNYTFDPRPNYSSSNYTLCYKCHEESLLLNDASGFQHRLHLREEQESCINCHDPHGSQKYPHLLNFLVQTTYGGRNYQITGSGGFAEPTWRDDGVFRGTCSLNCHGENHNPERYGHGGGH